MQLKLKRSQKTSGLIAKSVVFMLDARADLSEEEKANVKKYDLGKTIIYNSERSKRFLEAGQDASQSSGLIGLFRSDQSTSVPALSVSNAHGRVKTVVTKAPHVEHQVSHEPQDERWAFAVVDRQARHRSVFGGCRIGCRMPKDCAR